MTIKYPALKVSINNTANSNYRATIAKLSTVTSILSHACNFIFLISYTLSSLSLCNYTNYYKLLEVILFREVIYHFMKFKNSVNIHIISIPIAVPPKFAELFK